MKKFIAPLLVGAALTSGFASDDLKKEIEALKAQMAELKNAQTKMNIDALRAQVSEIKAHDAGDNIKWNVDFRTAYDVVDYKVNTTPIPLGGGAFYNPQNEKNGIWTNKIILGMASQPADNLVFKGSLGAYKTFGQNNIDNTSMFQGFDWYGTQKPSDSSIKLREAYFLYFGDMGDIHYSASFGRRPSVDGFMTNLRADNADPASPVGHNINMEFDGASFKFDLDKLTGISGLYAKICLGRGFSQTTGSYSGNPAGGFNPGYIKDDFNPNMDLAGLLVQLYDDGQYKVMANYFKGWNMMGAQMGLIPVGYVDPANNGYTQPVYMPGITGFMDVGDMTGGSLSLQVNGIGDGISDFLDDSVFFVSYAFNKTDPNSNGMLGSLKSETGDSYYAGVQVPGFMNGQRLGLEYNHGSQYWRSFTYGEDTLAGSKLSTRGDAYEIYYTLPLVGKNLTAQLSYVYMDYDYTGSESFFGAEGAANDIDSALAAGAVKSASNIRISARYRY